MWKALTIPLNSYKKKEVEVTENLHPFVSRFTSTLTKLHSMKSHRMMKYWQYRNEYSQRDISFKTEDGYTNYHLNTWFAIVNSKIAEIITNTPKFDFVALDDEAKRYKRIRELHWQYVWATSRTDTEIVKIITDALKYGVGFGEEIVLRKCRKVKTPKKSSDWETYEYTEEEIVEYEGCKLEHIPYAQVYVNWSNIENSTIAITISYWDRDEFLLTFGNDPKYSGATDDNIPKGKYYYIGQGWDSMTINWNSDWTSRASNTAETPDIVSVAKIYNKYRDEYGVIANNVWINPLTPLGTEGDKWDNKDNIAPIPYPHKEIPLVIYTDHVLEDDIYGMGEFDITERSRQLQDDIRSVHLEWIKSQWGLITIDPDSDYDETVMKLGIRQVARVEKDSFWFFSPSINLQSLITLEKTVWDDIIVESGVDYRSQIFGPNETAARTEGRIAAAKKRINHNIKTNAYTFYERLARLRSANIEFYYSDKTSKLPVKWLEVSANGTIEYIQNGYWLFTMKPEYFKWKIALIPIVDSLYWDTSSEKKQKYLETAQLLLNMRDDKGVPEFSPRTIVEAGRWIIDEVIDIDKVMGKTDDSKSPEEIMNDAGLWGSSQDTSQPDAQWGIPPAQMSWRPVLLGSSAKQ